MCTTDHALESVHTHHDVPPAGRRGEKVLTIRAHSGISGDMFLTGLLLMTGTDSSGLEKRLSSIMPELSNSVKLATKEVNHITGWHVNVELPHQHTHRTLADCKKIISGSKMVDKAKVFGLETFRLLARAEAKVHGKKPEEIHFHEVGALDSILDICLTCQLFAELAPALFVMSPLPMCDGCIACAHGIIPVPAPAVVELLEGVPVRPFQGDGETVTPTAMALLRALGAQFGPWPSMRVEKQALVYGTRIFPNAPNGALFALGAREE